MVLLILDEAFSPTVVVVVGFEKGTLYGPFDNFCESSESSLAYRIVSLVASSVLDRLREWEWSMVEEKDGALTLVEVATLVGVVRFWVSFFLRLKALESADSSPEPSDDESESIMVVRFCPAFFFRLNMLLES